MAYTLYINDGIRSVNVSDYILSIDDIPVYGRNNDYSLITEGFNFNISINLPNAIKKDDMVYVFSGSVIIFSGYVKQTDYDYNKLSNNVTVEHRLMQLKDNLVQEETYGDIFNTYGESKVCNTQSYTLISNTELLKALFSKIGITLDTTTYYTEGTRTCWGYYGYQTDVPNYDQDEYLNVLDNEIWYLPEQLWAINQDHVTWHDWIDNNDVTEPNKISAWDLISFLCTWFSIMFIPKSTTEFYLVNRTGGFSLEDRYRYSYEIESFKKKKDGITLFQKTYSGTTSNIIRVGGYEYQNPHWFPTNVYRQRAYIVFGNVVGAYAQQNRGQSWPNGVRSRDCQQIDWYSNITGILFREDRTNLLEMVSAWYDNDFGTNQLDAWSRNFQVFKYTTNPNVFLNKNTYTTVINKMSIDIQNDTLYFEWTKLGGTE